MVIAAGAVHTAMLGGRDVYSKVTPASGVPRTFSGECAEGRQRF